MATYLDWPNVCHPGVPYCSDICIKNAPIHRKVSPHSIRNYIIPLPAVEPEHFTYKLFYFFLLLMCVCHQTHVKVSRQLSGVVSLLPLWILGIKSSCACIEGALPCSAISQSCKDVLIACVQSRIAFPFYPEAQRYFCLFV